MSKNKEKKKMEELKDKMEGQIPEENTAEGGEKPDKPEHAPVKENRIDKLYRKYYDKRQEKADKKAAEEDKPNVWKRVGKTAGCIVLGALGAVAVSKFLSPEETPMYVDSTATDVQAIPELPAGEPVLEPSTEEVENPMTQTENE